MIVFITVSTPILVFLLLIALVLFKALVPMIIGLILYFAAFLVIYIVFGDKSGDSEETLRHKSITRNLLIGLSALIPGLIICKNSSDSYYDVWGSLVIGGPRPLGIALAFLGLVITIVGVIRLLFNR